MIPAALVGQRFGRLVVTARIGATPGSKDVRVFWSARCDCGASHSASTQALRSGGVRSCGCLALDSATKHGHKSRGQKSRHRFDVLAVDAEAVQATVKELDALLRAAELLVDELRRLVAAGLPARARR